MATHIILGELDIAPLLKAQKMFAQGLEEAKSPLEKTGATQRFEAIRKRNLTVHTYDEKLADDIFTWLPSFKNDLDAFVANIVRLT